MDAKTLLAYAHEAKENAYAPYSGYKVGAAVLLCDGAVVLGCNVENTAQSATICCLLYTSPSPRD